MLPLIDGYGVGQCSGDKCPEYDGKRCRLTGSQPHGVCEPWATEAARLVRDLWVYAAGGQWGEMSADRAASEGEAFAFLYHRTASVLGVPTNRT